MLIKVILFNYRYGELYMKENSPTLKQVSEKAQQALAINQLTIAVSPTMLEDAETTRHFALLAQENILKTVIEDIDYIDTMH